MNVCHGWPNVQTCHASRSQMFAKQCFFVLSGLNSVYDKLICGSAKTANDANICSVCMCVCVCVCVGGGVLMLIVADEKLSASFLFPGNFRGIHLFRRTLAPKSNRALYHTQGLLTRFPEILRVIYVLLNRYVIFSA